eukprot:CAMPEP_0194361596 /NCGR_PEP_ID=MMETSP0174-20130528/9139_1 /TAXON_ID=216777 /ORGANISM="Proboscia alata, Strain PI-D3" /LENGTH=495 /DNA_ID=CAMNT_0039133865 /DNA_START=49 /DNA_END=1536 /DNA_ORIENTATION=-
MAKSSVPDAQSSSGSDEEDAEQIRITLTPASGIEETDLHWKLTGGVVPITVPADIRRRGLSVVVNHLLGRTADSDEQSDDEEETKEKLAPIPFDFLLNGRLLRMGLETVAKRDGLSLEEALEIVYFPAVSAPQGSGSSEEMPDWISCLVGVGGNGGTGGGSGVCTGGYDGSIRWMEKCVEMASVVAHAGPIKCLAVDVHSTTIATGSIDQTLVTHTYNPQTRELGLHAVYSGGHSNSIESVALANTSSTSEKTLLASGDWMGGLCLWEVPRGDTAAESAPTKKAKTATNSTATAVREVQPTASWKAHASSISHLCYTHDSSPTSSKLISSSWDHSLKVWDVERQDCILTLNGNRVVSAMDRCSNSDVVATGHPDCTMRLWDMRTQSGGGGEKEGSTGVSEKTFRPSHKSWISALQWSPTDPFILATNSHDGILKLWDIRSSVPLHSTRAHEKGEKGLCLAFDASGSNTTDGDGESKGTHGIYTGGSDCVVKHYRF